MKSMNNIIKTCLLVCLVWISNAQSIFAELTVNNTTEIIKRLKEQAIEPNKIYFQYDFNNFINKDDSYPQKNLFSSLTALESKPDMHSLAIQNISEITLNENYQYSDVLERDRNIIEILYPTDLFQLLDDGVYFYIFNEHNQLIKKDTFAEVFELPCYVRVEKKNGMVVSIQKRPLRSITHYTYDYWANNNIKRAILEMYDNHHQVIYFDEVFFDEAGRRVKGAEKNINTGNTVIYSYIRQDGIERIEEYFDAKGIKTNHVTYYEKSHLPENKRLNEKGEIIEITQQRPADIFDFQKDLDESVPYNTLIMDIEKSDGTLTRALFKRVFESDMTIWDLEAINRAKFLGIKPKQVYYHKLPFPAFLDERYKNFPHQMPLTLIEAENQTPQTEYSELIKVEISDNYQYKKIIKEKWQQSPISLPVEQFKSLENGLSFFVMDESGKLSELSSVEQAVELPRYIRIEKVMGKIVSILQKTYIQRLITEFEYNGNEQIGSKLFTFNRDVMPDLIIETTYEKGNYVPLSQIIKNGEHTTIRTFMRHKDDDIFGIIEKFSNQGVKTNHIEVSQNGAVKNQYLGADGKVLNITDSFDDENNQGSYDDLLFYSDDFEMVRLSSF